MPRWRGPRTVPSSSSMSPSEMSSPVGPDVLAGARRRRLDADRARRRGRSTRRARPWSAPAGTGAPVMILTAVPGRERQDRGLAGADLADHGQRDRVRPRWRRRRPRRPRRSRPSRSCRSSAARSGATTSSASARPRASISGCWKAGSGETVARMRSTWSADRQQGRGRLSHAAPASSRTVPPSTRWAAVGVERDVADDLDAVAEGPVALDGERVGLAQRRRAVGEALVEVADQLVELAVERRRRAPRRRPGRARSPCRGRRRRSAAPAGRWSSSPAGTGRGRPRSCGRPRTPRSRRPSRSRSGSPRAWTGRPGSRCLALRISGRPSTPPRASSASTIASQVEPEVVGRAELVAVEVGQRLLVLVERLRGLAQHDPAVAACGGRSGRPCGPTAYAARPRSRTAHRSAANQPATRASGTAPRLSELETKT